MNPSLTADDLDRVLVLPLGPSLDAAGCAAAVEALNVAEGTPGLEAVLLCAGGPAGSAGRFVPTGPGDAARAAGADAATQLAALDALHGLLRTVHALELPTLVAVEGLAAGAGCALAAAADLRFAATTALFHPLTQPWTQPRTQPGTPSLPPVDRRPEPPEEGAASRLLAAALPRAAALAMGWHGAPLAAPRLHALGWIEALCPPGEALRTALAWARALPACPAAVAARRQHKARLDALPGGLPPLHELLAQERSAWSAWLARAAQGR